jgi:acetyltransferase
MSIRNLQKLFHPSSVAVVGASNREGVPGSIVMHNLLQGGFEGPIMPVSAGEKAVAGVFAYPHIDALPVTPDLAVICSPAGEVAAIVRALGGLGTRAAIVMTDGLGRTPETSPEAFKAAVLAAAEPIGFRILGPNGLGLMVPGIGLNATIAHVPAMAGSIAFVSQSSSVSAAVLDWARARHIGFSYFISLGDTTDVDLADVIDYLGSDPSTRAILVYIETIRRGRAFMSAGRGASRNKPILVFKGGRAEAGQRVAAFRSGAVPGSDDVYDAAIRRAGMLRVYSFGELFAAVETLARAKPLKGERLAVVANGCGLTVMAVDQLVLNGGCLAELSKATEEKLKGLVPAGWPSANPVNIAGDAPAERYGEAVRILLSAAEVDAVLVLHAPTAEASSTDAARAVVDAVHALGGNVLTSWMGGDDVEPARQHFASAGIPTYDTPTRAVDAFLHMVRYRRNQDMLMETPASTPDDFSPATDAARIVIEDILAAGRSSLIGREAKALLAAYGIPTAETRFARTPEAAADAARQLGFPVALKIRSPDIRHKAEVGGVDLFLDSPDAVQAAAETMLVSVADKKPRAAVEGFTVERMVLRPGAQEVMISVADDPLLGPVIIFGHGGPAADVISDRAVGLPPLNMSLARELISRTRVFRLLQGYEDCPPANIDALCLTLVQISQMIIDLPEIVGLTINPLFADAHGVFAVDARIQLARPSGAAETRLAIRPYPKELEEEFMLNGTRKVLLRPIRPEDEPAHYEFLSKVSAEDIRFRFFGLIRNLPHTEMARLTQIDYDREMAFIATAAKADGSGPETLGVVRTVTDLNNETAEYAILVRSDLKGQRLGWKLLDKMIRYCASRGTRRIEGQVLRENKRMLDLVKSMGFKAHKVPDEDIYQVTLQL